MSVLPAVRRLVARRPWVQWIAILGVALALAATVGDAMARLEEERSAWGTGAEVWVADRNVDVGQPITARMLVVPERMRPAAAVAGSEPIDGLFARQTIGRGEIVVHADLWAPDDELALAPDGWLVAPVVEAPPSGAGPGDRVLVVSDGFVLADDGVVVASLDGVTLVAVHPDVAPLLPAAESPISLLRLP